MHTPEEVEGLYLVGILGGGVPPDSPSPDPIWDQKPTFSHPFSELPWAEIMSSLLRLEHQRNLKTISNSHITLSFLFISN